jgi:hypothetical protein
MKRSTLYSGIVAAASMVTLVACQDAATGLRAGPASYAKGPGGGGTVTPPPAPAPITGGTGMTAAAAGEVPLYCSPCNVIILAPGNAGLAGQTVVFASPGQTVKLYADAASATGGDFSCTVVADPNSPLGTGLTSGEGLVVQSPNITVDLNGTTLLSDGDASAATGGLGENHGVLVKSDNVTLTNTSTKVSTAAKFTVGVALAQVSNVKFFGQQISAPTFGTPGTAGQYNIALGLAGGVGASLKLDRVTGGTVRSISAVDNDPTNIESRGIAVVRSSNLLISDVDAEGQASGIRFRDTQNARIENSFACGPVMGPVEFDRNLTNVTSSNIATCAAP